MKKILFFGDSLTSGENNNFDSYADKLNLKYSWNFAISGTTIGDYSLYPVGETHLLKLLEMKDKSVRAADIIFLAYGANDITSAAMKYVSISNVLMDLNKSIDLIKQKNPECKIYYILPSQNKNVILSMAEANENYLKEYLSGIKIDKNFIKRWVDGYKDFHKYIKHKFIDDIFYMISDERFMEERICSDGLHPDDYGYEIIKNNIEGQLLSKSIII